MTTSLFRAFQLDICQLLWSSMCNEVGFALITNRLQKLRVGVECPECITLFNSVLALGSVGSVCFKARHPYASQASYCRM
jgi:hypothetical protein